VVVAGARYLRWVDEHERDGEDDRILRALVQFKRPAAR
jgi:hypothetical protein